MDQAESPRAQKRLRSIDIDSSIDTKKRRVLGRLRRGANGIAGELMSRELQGPSKRVGAINSATQTILSKYSRVIEVDTHDPNDELLALSFLKMRSKVTEMIYGDGILFVLTSNGLCVAYDAETGNKYCMMNIAADQVIRSIFFNRRTMSIITVSVYRSDHFISLRCRATPTVAVRRGMPDLGMNLFESERLQYPGFMEFDDTNGIIVTVSCKLDQYKVWNLNDYRLRYEVHDPHIHDIKISPGVLMVLYQKTGQHIPISFLSSVDGSVKRAINLLVKRGKSVEFIEQFDNKLVVKQRNDNLSILDIQTMECVEVPESRNINPSAFMFMDKNHSFLACRDRTFAVYNIKGEVMSTFENHSLYFENFNTRFTALSRQQDMLLSYCRDSDNKGSILLTHIPTGRLITRTAALPSTTPIDAAIGEDVTSITYIEEKKQIVVGDAHGRVYIWIH